MAALRIFARVSARRLAAPCTGTSSRRIDGRAIPQIFKRWSTFRSSSIYEDPSKYTDFEIEKNPEEWKYVERLLKPKLIPLPPLEPKEYPSGWKPPTCVPGTYPYHVQRTRNFMLPVYLKISYRGMRRETIIDKVEGDIVMFRDELQKHIEERVGKPIGCKLQEFACSIKFRGDYVSIVKDWLEKKGM